ncbi:MAG: extracellular solute-binding protein [Nocardiopsaceae bacterium]|nr:extracellular solute-binding protein [Nocardiopsaceae bacterium]
MRFRSVARGCKSGAVGGALAIGLAAVAVTGCGSSGSGSSGGMSGQTLTVYTQAPYGTQLKQYKQYYDYIANAFHKATGSTIKWDYSSNAVSEAQALSQAAASSTGPDVWAIGSSFNGTASALKEFYTLPVSKWRQFGGVSSFVHQQLTMSGPNPSSYIGVPYESIPFVLAYNKALFAKAHITSPPATWSQFIADAKAIQKADPGVNGASFSPADPYGPWKAVWSYLEQSGGDFLSANGTKADLTSPQMQAALKFYFGLEDTYHVVPKADLTWTAAQETTAFTDGKTGMMLDAEYALKQEAAGTPAAKDVGFAPMPDVPLGMTSRPAGAPAAGSIVSGNYYDVAKYYQNLPLAMKFIQISTSAAAQLQQFKIMGWMPVNKAGIAAVEKYDPATKPFIQAEATSTPTDYTPAWSYIETGVLSVIGHIAQQLATGQSYSNSYAMSQLQAENSVVQAHLSSGG